MKEPTITILGLGNILMTDEGVGVHTVNEFERRYQVPDYVEIVDGGAAGLDLIPFIEGREKVMMVDAVNFDREPGYIDLLENDSIPIRLTQKVCSTSRSSSGGHRRFRWCTPRAASPPIGRSSVPS